MTAAWSTRQMPSLHDKVALVTGANSGLGLEIAKSLALAGSAVVLACRNVDKANRAADDIRRTGAQGDVSVLRLDLADLSSVATAAKEFRDSGKSLDLLINNAGLMAVDHAKTADGFEMQFGVNHLGHFALTAELLPTLLATPGSRVITMASMGHRMGKMNFDDLMHTKYDRWPPYFQSKLANLLFTAELHRRLQARGVTTIALTAHPGASNTDLGTEGKGFSNYAMKIVPLLSQSAAMGPNRPCVPQPIRLRSAASSTARGSWCRVGPLWKHRVDAPATRTTPSGSGRSPRNSPTAPCCPPNGKRDKTV